jgi:hypothetical protein
MQSERCFGGCGNGERRQRMTRMVFVVELVVVAEKGTTLAVTLVVGMSPTSRVRAAEQQICRWCREDVHE